MNLDPQVVAFAGLAFCFVAIFVALFKRNGRAATLAAISMIALLLATIDQTTETMAITGLAEFFGVTGASLLFVSFYATWKHQTYQVVFSLAGTAYFWLVCCNLGIQRFDGPSEWYYNFHIAQNLATGAFLLTGSAALVAGFIFLKETRNRQKTARKPQSAGS